MKNLHTYQEEELVYFLTWTILLFLGGTLFFLSATFIKRLRKLRAQRQTERLQQISDELLFNLLFGNTSLEASLSAFKQLDNAPLLNKTITRSIISLHRNYSGEQRKSLENFLVMSDLASFFYKKLKSTHWVEVVEGIRVLTVLNVHESFQLIKLLLDHPSNYVKKEAFIGLIALEGTEGLERFTLPKIVIDDWTQSCIIYQLKINHFNTFDKLNLLLESENDSLVILGARIVDYFQVQEYYQVVQSNHRKLQPKFQKSLETFQKRITNSHLQ